jgi:hypothetical protein
MSLEELRQAIANPARDFPAKAVVAGVWWFQHLLHRVGDRWQDVRTSRDDKKTAALLLCVAMDGEHGKNDDLAPVIAAMLRPYCPALSFVEAWEQANGLPPGTARATAAEILGSSGKGLG